MAKSHASQRNRSDGAKHHAFKGDRPENRPENLIFYVVTSILLHSVVLITSDYWLRAFAPKQEVSQPIPIEFVEVPPNQTKMPPETSQRAVKNSVAGGKAKPGKPISTELPAQTATPKTNTGSEPSEILLPQQTQQKTVSSNPLPQKLQAKPQKIAIAPATKPLAPEPKPTAVAPVTKLAEPSPTAVTQKPKLPEPESSPTAVAPVTKPPEPESSPTAVTPKPQLPEPEEPLPTAVAPTTNPLALKLRQRTITPTIPPETEPYPTALTPKPQPPETSPSPTAVAPTINPLPLKLRQRTIPPQTTLPEPEPLPTAVAPKPKPLALKPRQTVLTPTMPPEPEASPTAVAPTTKPLALKLRQRTITPKPQLTETQPYPTTVAPTTKPLALKPRQTVVTPDTTPSVPSTRRENSSRLAAKSSSEQFQNTTNSLLSPGTPPRASSRSQNQSTTSSRKLSRSQASSKSGGASRLGGPISVSSGDYGTNNLAALPNSNRLNQGTQGIDARKDADMGAYLQQLQQQVKQNWIPGLTQSSQRTVLQFTVSRAGLVSNLHVAQSSGFGMTDEAALNAINRAVPFAPFPTEYTKDYINIQFTFNINVYGQLELSND